MSSSTDSASSSSDLSDSADRLADQGLAAWIAKLNHERRIPLFEALDALEVNLQAQDNAFVEALKEIDWVREKIGSPEHILGNPKTKHGEIAEMAEVGIRRARDILRGESLSASWDPEDRIGPDDYWIDGVGVQSKFINGINNGLQHVLDHARRYPEQAKADKYYHIPKDQYEDIQQIRTGGDVDFNSRTVRAINQKIERLEELKGRSFEDLVQPGSHDYADVQQGKIHDTLDQHEADLNAQNETVKQETVEEHRDDVEAAQEQAAPSLGEAAQVVALGAAFGAGVQTTVTIYQKWSLEGKLPRNFTQEDWEEVGITSLSGGAKGGISAGAIYAMTNYSALSAPLAGAVVSSGRAMVALNQQYQDGSISFDEFADLSIVASSEAGMSAVGAALGQAVIPVPILGALVGGAAAQVVSTHAKGMAEDQEKALSKRLNAQHEAQIASLDKEHCALLAQLEADMIQLGDLTSAAFNLDINARLLVQASIQLAEAHNVPDGSIMRTNDDVDAFILGESEEGSYKHNRRERARS